MFIRKFGIFLSLSPLIWMRLPAVAVPFDPPETFVCAQDLAGRNPAQDSRIPQNHFTEADLRSVLAEDGFTATEIDQIFQKAHDLAVISTGKPVHVAGASLDPEIARQSYGLEPEVAVKFWPFLILANPDLDVSTLLRQALQIGWDANHLLLKPLARWAQFLSPTIRSCPEIRALVLRAFRNERLGSSVDGLVDAFGFTPRELGPLRSDSLTAVTLVSARNRPPEVLEDAVRDWMIPGILWEDLVDSDGALWMTAHTDHFCDTCPLLVKTHHQTLLESLNASYGRSALIRSNGVIIGAIKGMGHPSFLALRNVGRRPGERNFIWAGAAYQPTAELVRSAMRAIEFNPNFPVVDVRELQLSPLRFADPERRVEWVYAIQKNLDAVLNLRSRTESNDFLLPR